MQKSNTSITPHISGLVKVPDDKLFTLDELKEVWYFSMLHGATLWQYCQDTEKQLPEAFNVGIHGLLSKVITAHDLQEVLKSRALMVGIFEELVTASKDNHTTKDTGQLAELVDTSL